MHQEHKPIENFSLFRVKNMQKSIVHYTREQNRTTSICKNIQCTYEIARICTQHCTKCKFYLIELCINLHTYVYSPFSYLSLSLFSHTRIFVQIKCVKLYEIWKLLLMHIFKLFHARTVYIEFEYVLATTNWWFSYSGQFYIHNDDLSGQAMYDYKKKHLQKVIMQTSQRAEVAYVHSIKCVRLP